VVQKMSRKNVTPTVLILSFFSVFLTDITLETSQVILKELY